MPKSIRIAAVAALAGAALGLPAASAHAVPDCEDAEPGQTCIRWCYPPGPTPGEIPCGVRIPPPVAS